MIHEVTRKITKLKLLRVAVRRRLAGLPLAELLHWLKHLLAITVLREIDAATLLHAPLTALDELGWFRYVATETRRGAAGIQTGTSEQTGRDRAGESGFFLVTRHGFVDASLVVGVAPKVPAFGHHLFAPGQEFVFVARLPDNSADNNSNDQQHYDDCDGEQSLKPTWHSSPPFRN